MPIVDTSVTTTKKITVAELLSLTPVLGTPQATTSGTSKDYTSIPTGTKRITVMIAGLSTNGSSVPIIQLGDSGGIEVTGYLVSAGDISGGAAAQADYTTGFGLCQAIASASALHGQVILSLQNASTNTWVASGCINHAGGTRTGFVAGSKSLSAELTQLRITTVNGTDAFDAGAININYE